MGNQESKKIKKLDEIILATSTRKQDKELIKISKKLKLNFLEVMKKMFFQDFVKLLDCISLS